MFTTVSGYDPAAWLTASGSVDAGVALAPATATPSGSTGAVELQR